MDKVQCFNFNIYILLIHVFLKTERREQHLTPGKFTPLKLPEGTPEDGGSIVEISRHRLRVIEKLGEGLFGMVKYRSYVEYARLKNTIMNTCY